MEGQATVMPATQEPAMNLLARIWNVWVAPKKAFANVKLYPRWVVPFFLLLAIHFAVWPVVAPQVAKDAEQIVNTSPRFENVPAEQKEKMIAGFHQGLTVKNVIQGVLISTIITVLMGALFLFFTNVLLGGQVKYWQTTAVFIYSGFILIPEYVLKLPLIFAKKSALVATGPGLFVSAGEGFGAHFLSAIDFFGLWQAGVVAVGLGVLAGSTTKKAGIWVFSAWGLWVIIKAALSYFSGGLSRLSF